MTDIPHTAELIHRSCPHDQKQENWSLRCLASDRPHLQRGQGLDPAIFTLNILQIVVNHSTPHRIHDTPKIRVQGLLPFPQFLPLGRR